MIDSRAFWSKYFSVQNQKGKSTVIIQGDCQLLHSQQLWWSGVGQVIGGQRGQQVRVVSELHCRFFFLSSLHCRFGNIFLCLYNNSLLVVVPTGCANLSDLGTEIYIVCLHCASEFRLYPCSYFCSVTLTIHLGTLSFKWSTEPHLLRLLVSQIQVLILSIPSQLCNYSDAFCLGVKF